jgi:hypothetical protein
VEVGQYFRSELIDLIYLTRMDQRFDRGSQVESVEVVLQDSGRSSMALYADRNLVDSSNFFKSSDCFKAESSFSIW